MINAGEILLVFVGFPVSSLLFPTLFCFFFLLPDVDCTVDERLYRCRIDDPLQETSREQRIEDGRGVG